MMNYPSKDIPWTRIVEHKHFTNVKTDYTIITREYPAEWDKSKTPYYPINDDRNTEIYKKYLQIIFFGNSQCSIDIMHIGNQIVIHKSNILIL